MLCALTFNDVIFVQKSLLGWLFDGDAYRVLENTLCFYDYLTLNFLRFNTIFLKGQDFACTDLQGLFTLRGQLNWTQHTQRHAPCPRSLSFLYQKTPIEVARKL